MRGDDRSGAADLLRERHICEGEVMNILGWLTVLFVGLKLTGFITWSWLWVLSPLWIPTLVVLMLVVIGLIAHLLDG